MTQKQKEMEQPLILQSNCIECKNYDGFGQCLEYGNKLVDDCEMFASKESNKDLVILPEKKMEDYIKYCNDKNPFMMLCDTCKCPVEIERMYPYFYDTNENDVYFACVCPKCGELMIIKE